MDFGPVRVRTTALAGIDKIRIQHEWSSSTLRVMDPPSSPARRQTMIASPFRTVLDHFKKHVGIGIICSVGYFDPYAICLSSAHRIRL